MYNDILQKNSQNQHIEFTEVAATVSQISNELCGVTKVHKDSFRKQVQNLYLEMEGNF